MAIRRLSNIGIQGTKSSKVWDQETFPGFYEAIATAVVDSSNASSITFSNIPQNYKHLEIRYLGKCTQTGSGYSVMQIRFNGDSGTNYSGHELVGDGSSATSGGAGTDSASSQAQIQIRWGQTSAQFSVGIINILDYTSTTKNKTLRALSGWDNNGSGYVQLGSGSWQNSSTAITQIDILPKHNSIIQYSHFALYGLRG